MRKRLASICCVWPKDFELCSLLELLPLRFGPGSYHGVAASGRRGRNIHFVFKGNGFRQIGGVDGPALRLQRKRALFILHLYCRGTQAHSSSPPPSAPSAPSAAGCIPSTTARGTGSAGSSFAVAAASCSAWRSFLCVSIASKSPIVKKKLRRLASLWSRKKRWLCSVGGHTFTSKFLTAIAHSLLQ
eukprot:GHVT01081770.1.p1 GENE.GHVT01081770.1~~GHVT01081770.1.p1  ORF type:complete len:187 (-),score=39.39 GHVT01081770.1:912-1472(-)